MRCLTSIRVTSRARANSLSCRAPATLARIVTARSVTREAGQPFRDSKPLEKEGRLAINGFIEEMFPDGRFAVRLDNEHGIIACTAGKMRKFRVRPVVSD